MRKKILFGFIFSLLALVLMTSEAQAGMLFDDFNDGDANGWISVAGYPPGTHGNWRVEDGVVVQDQGRDHFGFVLDNFSVSDQIVEAKVLWHDNGYAGITIWNQDANNWVQISYPYQGGFGIWENINGNGLVYPTAIYPVTINQRVWQTLRVKANSLNGEITVYLDGNYLFTHTVGSDVRKTGSSGFNSGNAGGRFDDFRLLISESDSDEDGINDESDNCPSISNPDQVDTDRDGQGDVCDIDNDNDGVLDESDCNPLNGSIWRDVVLFSDEDSDGVTFGDGVKKCIGNSIPVGWAEARNGEDCAPSNSGVSVLVGTKACFLWSNGVKGKGILSAPGMRKPFHENKK